MNKTKAEIEAKKRWGDNAILEISPYVKLVYLKEKLLNGVEKEWGYGETWEEAFEDADERIAWEKEVNETSLPIPKCFDNAFNEMPSEIKSKNEIPIIKTRGLKRVLEKLNTLFK